MSKIKTGFVLGFIFTVLACSAAFATTYTASSCAQAAVQSAINQASGGDTVVVPSGSCAWTSGVTISGKGIILTGQGSGRIIAYSSDTLTLGNGTKTINITSTSVHGTLSISNGQTLTVSETGTRTNVMTGTVTSYSNGVLTLNVTSASGTCHSNNLSNCKRWIVSTQPTTTIVNNSSTTLFSINEDPNNDTNVSGIKIAEGTGTGDGFDFLYTSNGLPILLHDCWIEQGNSPSDSVRLNTNRGVIWNCSFDSTPFSMAPIAVHMKGAPASSWTSTSTMGMNDPTGQSNLYVEDCDFHAYLNATDIDDNGRVVFRYTLFNNAGFGTHGADTSNYGQRHFEYYNNIGVFNAYSDGTTFDMCWWFFIRGGTFVIYNNTLPALVSGDYGTKSDADMTVMNLQRNAGPDACWGAGTTNGRDYHAPRQVGMGYVTGQGHDGLGRTDDSITYVGDSEPGYIWGNSRQPLGNTATEDYGGTECTNPDTSANYIVLNRDYFNGSTAKPGWTPYTYPHPLRGGGGSPPSPPSNLQALPQ